ncbi:MAG: hypothetical protein IPK80_14640 [Nannocystis sp.]|nr:hypothetical protein [Nannocystis sp.]
MPHFTARQLTRLLALPLALTACGDDGPVATTAATSSSDTSATSEATADSGTEASSTSESSGATSSDTSTSTSDTTSSDTSDTSTTADTTTSDTDTTTGDPGASCVKDSDCVLINDCCQCDPKGVGEPVAECNINCLQPSCDAVGLAKAEAVCHWGVCTFQKVLCNPLGITCKALQPDCGPGTVASVHEIDGEKCWTGTCVPAEACDWAPDCATCDAAALTCVAKLQKGAYVLCEPTPPACGEAVADCGCAEIICESSPPHTVCSDQEGGIACECPFC